MVLGSAIAAIRGANRRYGIALGVLVIALGAVAILSNSDRHRFSVRLGPCYYHHLFAESGDVDLLVLGGSSMMAAVDPQRLSDALASIDGIARSVLNIAQPWYGADAVFHRFEALTARRATKSALVMVKLDGGYDIHRRAYVTWRWGQLWATLTAPSRALIERTSEVVRLSMKRLRDSVFHPKGALDRYRRDNARYLRQFTGPNTCFRKNLADAERVDRLHRARERVLRDGIGTAEFTLDRKASAYPLHYLKRLTANAKARGIGLIFIRMPDLWQSRWSERTLTSIGTLLGAPVIEMPIGLRWQIFKADGYRDERHLVTAGRELFTPWLAGAVAPLLAPVE